MEGKFKPFLVEARDLPDLWFQGVYNVLHEGGAFEVDKGSYQGQQRLEYNYFVGHVADPSYGSGTPEILPHIPEGMGIPDPTTFDYVYLGEERPDGTRAEPYLDYIMTSNKQPNEAYTYGERLTKARLDGDKLAWWEKQNSEIINRDKEVDGNIIFEEDGDFYLNQVEEMIDTYKRFGHRNNQMVLQVGEPTDRLLKDPPCLRQIDTRIQDSKLHFIVNFRSWDLWNGFPANLAAIEYLQKYISSEIGVNQGEFIVESKGLHLYDHVWKLAEQRTQLEGIIAEKNK